VRYFLKICLKIGANKLIQDKDIIEKVIEKFGWRATSKQYKPHITVGMLKQALSRLNINQCGCATFYTSQLHKLSIFNF